MTLINKDNSQVKLSAEGKIIQIIDALGKSTSFAYGTNNEIKELSDNDGTFYTADGLNWYKKGNSPPCTPDRIGAIAISDNYSILKSSISGRQCVIKHTDGTTTLTDKNGTKTRFDHKGNLLQVIDGEGKQTNFSYDKVGRLTCTIILNTDSSQIKLNETGQIVELMNINGEKTSLKYGANGQPNEVSDWRGTYYTKDGSLWFLLEERRQTVPFLHGEIRVNGDGALIEFDYNDKSITARFLDGTKKTYELPQPLDFSCH